MSDSDDNKEAAHERSEKKRKIQRACDMCRRRKTKCDGPQSKTGVCSFCIAGSFKCTYVEAATKRGPPKGYLEAVEKRMLRLEALVEKLAPGRDFTSELGARIPARDTFDLATHSRQEPRTCSSASPTPNRPVLSPSSLRQASETMDDSETDEEEASLRETLRTFSLDERHVVQGGFLGKSSGIHLVTSIQNLRQTKSQSLNEAIGSPVSSPPWEKPDEASEPHPSSSFWPDPDLVRSLLDSYFDNINAYHPVLHRPTFERDFASKLYERDHGFAELCLIVFALGSQDLDDPRVRDVTEEETSTGWSFFRGFLRGRKTNWGDLAGIHGIQAVTLASFFITRSGDSKLAWVLMGVGLRACIGLGVHRKHVARVMSPALGELFKRCFWSLYVLDRSSSAIFGRPVGIQDEDMDVDYPIEVDDEFWECEDPSLNFKQPESQPSKISAFVSSIKLHEIIGTTLKTVYPITKNKTKRSDFDTLESQKKLIQKLDSELNSWVASLPDHLRWNPHDNATLFFGQAAILHSTFYATQILVHRPFIPSPTRPSRIGFPSLAICSNAARSGTHVLEIALTTDRREAISSSVRLALLGQGFIFSVVLLISIWGAKGGGSVGDQARSSKNLSMIIDLVAAQEKRWLFCGRLKLVLLMLSSQSSSEPVVASTKRVREEETVVNKPSILGGSTANTARPTTGRTPANKPAFATAGSSSSTSSFRTDGLSRPSLPSTSTSIPPSFNGYYSPTMSFEPSSRSPTYPPNFAFSSLPPNSSDPPLSNASSQASTFNFNPQQQAFTVPNFFNPPPPQQADELLGQRLPEAAWAMPSPLGFGHGFDASFFGAQLPTEEEINSMGGGGGVGGAGGMVDFGTGAAGMDATSTPWSGFEPNDWTSYLASFSMPP